MVFGKLPEGVHYKRGEVFYQIPSFIKADIPSPYLIAKGKLTVKSPPFYRGVVRLSPAKMKRGSSYDHSIGEVFYLRGVYLLHWFPCPSGKNCFPSE
jgi:hypothetical protein